VTDMYIGQTRHRTPVHLWIIGVLSLLWNSMGAFDYLATQMKLDFYMSQFTETQLAYFYAFPTWAVSCWALAVWVSVLASLGLLLRRKWSVAAFAVSFVGMMGSSIYTFGLSNGAEIMGSEGVIFSVVIWVVALLLLWYSSSQAKRDVLV